VNPTLKAAIALTLALLFAIPASGETPTHSVTRMPDATVHVLSSPPNTGGFLEVTDAVAGQSQGLGQNPPAHVRQPGRRTRLIVAIVFVGGLTALALLFCGHGGCGR
jgi:hypothetical protein